MIAFLRRFQVDSSLIGVGCCERISSLFLNITNKAFNRAAVRHIFGTFGASQSVVKAANAKISQGKIIEQIAAVWSELTRRRKIKRRLGKQIGAAENFRQMRPDIDGLLWWQSFGAQLLKCLRRLEMVLDLVLKTRDARRDAQLLISGRQPGCGVHIFSCRGEMAKS